MQDEKENIINTTNPTEFENFIRENLKSFGSRETADQLLGEVQVTLFKTLFSIARHSGASFDPEIVFNMFITDCQETMQRVYGSFRLVEEQKLEKNDA